MHGVCIAMHAFHVVEFGGNRKKAVAAISHLDFFPQQLIFLNQ
jgi:hypothetical protein